MNKLASLVLSLLLLAGTASAGPKVWNKTGTATVTSVTLTVGSTATPFGPASICVKNTGATNNLFFNLTPPAVATDNSLNFIVEPGLEYCIAFASQNVVNIMEIAVITPANTTTYSVKAVASR